MSVLSFRIASESRGRGDPNVSILILITDKGDLESRLWAEIMDEQTQGSDSCIESRTVISECLNRSCHRSALL
jgi:hypothetical protein